jgi:hypothetical protein
MFTSLDKNKTDSGQLVDITSKNIGHRIEIRQDKTSKDKTNLNNIVTNM